MPLQLNQAPSGPKKNVLPDIDFIKAIHFYAYAGEGEDITSFETPTSLNYRGAGYYRVKLQNIEDIEDTLKGKKDLDLFLEIEFNNKLSAIEGYKQYNFNSSWFIPVKLINHKIVNGRYGVKNGGYAIIRHPKTGEVPDFEWREAIFRTKYTSIESAPT